MGETRIKVKGVWKYLYRAVDRQGKTDDFLLTAKRDVAAAERFFDKAMGANGEPGKVAMDKRGAKKAAIDPINAGHDVPIVVRRVKYLNNIVEQDHRAIKRVTRPMPGFKSFQCAAGVELMHMIQKGQFAFDGTVMSFADQFYALAGQIRPALTAAMFSTGNSVSRLTTRQNRSYPHPTVCQNDRRPYVVCTHFLKESTAPAHEKRCAGGFGLDDW